MNKHPTNFDVENKSIWDQAVRKVKCPTCGCDPLHYCERMPPAKTAGAKRWPPHLERVKALYAMTPGGVDAFRMNVSVGGPPR